MDWYVSATARLADTQIELDLLSCPRGAELWETVYGKKYPGASYWHTLVAQQARLLRELSEAKHGVVGDAAEQRTDRGGETRE